MRTSRLNFRPEFLDTLSAEELMEFNTNLERLVGGETLDQFVNRIAPHEPIPDHLSIVRDVLEQARVKPIRCTIDIGPGHAKTTMLCRGIAWWLTKSPGDLCGYLSYSDAQAKEKSAIAKLAYEAAGGALNADKKADGHWHTPHGGGLIAKGSQGGITGKRVPGLLVYDDPYRDVDEARSVAINTKIINRFKGVAFTRLQGGSIIVLHTRWAMDDLIGFIQKELKWDNISIPTVCDDENTDPLGRKLGQVAWPEKYPYELCLDDRGERIMCSHDGHLKEIETTLGPHLWSAMYQGKPRPLGHAIFHEPARFMLSDFKWEGKRGVISMDPAATAKTSADWSVILVVATEGYGINTKMWIVDCIRIQVEIPELVKRAVRVQQQYRLMVACEAVAGFKAVPQSIKAIDPRIRVFEVNPGKRKGAGRNMLIGGGDKLTRSMALAAAWNDGRVFVPMDAPWADVLIDEFQRFTGSGDKHDDQVDAGSQAWNVLYRAQPRITELAYAEGGV